MRLSGRIPRFFKPATKLEWFRVNCLLLLALVAAMFQDVLFFNKTRVLSNPVADLYHQFIPWRVFGFKEMLSGNLPLWNPYIFSGTPFLGGFQSALLYPPNLLFTCLPLVDAINYSIALHVFLGGVFMYLWASHRGLHPLSCFLSAVLFMFCGAHFLHIYQGHLCNLCGIIWVPLILLGIDGWLDSRKPAWCCLGIFAVSLQILAGMPQYVFYTAVTAVIYSALRLVRSQGRLAACGGLVLIYAGAAAVTAVQLLTGLQASSETLRGAGLSYEFASMYSFPPENFLTFLVPGFFGDMTTSPYWGRCSLWEMSVFMGVTGFVLAIYGAVKGDARRRSFCATMAVILFIFALGKHTPLFDFLYRWVPEFDKFRGNSKFALPASVFMILLAGIGYDRLKSRRPDGWWLPGLACAGGLLLACLAVVLNLQAGRPDGIWPTLMQAVWQTGESYLDPDLYQNAAFVKQAGLVAAHGLLLASATLFALGACFALQRVSNGFSHLVLILAVAEMYFFARGTLDTFDISQAEPPKIQAFLDKNPGDDRIINVEDPNFGMLFRVSDLWGYDSVVERRYAEFMTASQGGDADHPTQYLQFSRIDPLYAMLRLGWVLWHAKNTVYVAKIANPMPRVSLISSYRVIPGRDAIFHALHAPGFNPRQEVILEQEPDPKPVASENPGSVRVTESSSDDLEIEAEVASPAILLVTDVYSPGWHASAVPGGSQVQQQYEVLPADYILRAIPLAAGHHQLRLEYRPWAFVVGKWISIFSLIVWCAFTGWVLLRARPGKMAATS